MLHHLVPDVVAADVRVEIRPVHHVLDAVVLRPFLDIGLGRREQRTDDVVFRITVRNKLRIAARARHDPRLDRVVEMMAEQDRLVGIFGKELVPLVAPELLLRLVLAARARNPADMAFDARAAAERRHELLGFAAAFGTVVEMDDVELVLRKTAKEVDEDHGIRTAAAGDVEFGAGNTAENL